MLQNYLVAAIRNLFRNRAYAGINICGLALGFASVILIALFVRDEHSYDRQVPGHELIYRVMATIDLPGRPTMRVAVTASNIAAALKLDFPEVAAATRLAPSQVVIRQGEVRHLVVVHWADPNFFQLFPMKVLSGNLAEALSRPDSIVLTEQLARRFFGDAEAVGKTVDFNGHAMRVAATIADLPSNTHMKVEVFAPGIASFSALTALDAMGQQAGALRPDSVYTYVQLRPNGNIAALEANLRGFINRHVTGEVNGVPLTRAYTFSLTPLTDIHLQPPSLGDMKPPGDTRTLHAMIAIGLVILIVASSNFVSMMTARSARRAIEVGVRKVAGATRSQIIVQFLGESMLYVALALLMAIVSVQLILPAFNAFLQRDIVFDYVRDPALGGGLLLTLLIVGAAAGAYPAFVLSLFRPGMVLKGITSSPANSGHLRQALVIFQFGTLIALIVATITVYRQTQYAMEDRLHLPADQIYVGTSGCPAAFREAVAQLSGVRAASCASDSALSMGRLGTVVDAQNGGKVSFRIAPVDSDFFKLFSVTPLAGRLFSQARGEDTLLRDGSANAANPSIILNESGAKALGFASPEAAVNQVRRWARIQRNGYEFRAIDSAPSQIIGVVPDFSVGSVREVIEPTVYYIDPSLYRPLVVKLDGAAIPETMNAMKKLWSQHEPTRALEGMFLSQHINELYADIQRQSSIFSAFSVVALVIASLGLLGLAVFTAERRTREIGLRKVMGASRWDILRFLGWQFTRPVLWANLVAWPAAYLFMRRWLEGFAYHVDLSPWVFIAASALALVIALVTVSGHALLVARAKPAEALRYE